MAIGIEKASGTGDVAVESTFTHLLGWSVRESASTALAATIIIRNGTTASDPAVAIIELAADKSETKWLGPQGIMCDNGIFVDRVAGETHIVIYVA